MAKYPQEHKEDPRAALPEWAQAIVPVDINGAATVLGVSRRYFVDLLKVHPHYERRGTKKVFYPEHITALREALSLQYPNQSKGRRVVSDMPRYIGKRLRESHGKGTGSDKTRALRRAALEKPDTQNEEAVGRSSSNHLSTSCPQGKG